jgi:hypothetical protein
MKSMRVFRASAIVACLALVVMLWKHWATLCNEACAPGRALSMQFLSVALPSVVAFAVFTASAPRPSRFRRWISWGLVAIFLLWGAGLSWAR